jgi:hypothetical protein
MTAAEGLTAVLAQFPNLQRCWQNIGSPTLEERYIGDLLATLRDDSADFGIGAVESALAVLLARFTPDELTEQVRDLFANGDRTEASWYKSWTELCALAYFQEHQILYSLGWPETTSDTPPFDFRLSISELIIPCDVKSASGSAFLLVNGELNGLVQRWAKDRGLGAVEFRLRYHGTLAQEVVGPSFIGKAPLNEFRTELDTLLKVPEVPLKLDLGAVKFKAYIGRSAQERTSGGIQGSDPLAASLVSTYRSHVVRKAKTAERENQTPFLLAYVQTPGTGMSDLKTASIFEKAISTVSAASGSLDHGAGELWLGSSLLDFRYSDPRMCCCLRGAARWPAGLTPKDLAQRAGGRLVCI